MVLAGAMALASARAWGTPQATPDAAPPGAVRPDVNSYVLQLAATLSQGTPQQRYEAAQRLVEVGTSSALTQFQNGLTSSDNATQLACARAASDVAKPDPAWTEPLQKLLGKDRPLTEAAALALAHLDTDASAQALIQFVNAAGRPFHDAAVAQMGHMVRKPLARALVAILDDPLEPRDVSAAASAALAQMSGASSPPEDPSAWHEWWTARVALSDAQWRARVIDEQHDRLQIENDRNRGRLTKESDSIQNLVRAQYDSRPTAEKPRVLLGFLNDADPAVRAAAAGIVPDAVSQGHPVPQDVRNRLIELIGDAAPDVRLKVAQALGKLADPNALEPLLRQLQIEKDLQVKVALVGAIGTANDPHAIAVLEGLLRDPSTSVAAAAAEALRALAPAIQQNNPQQADQVYGELKKVLIDRTGPPGQPVQGLLATDLRAALLEALSPLAGSHSDDMRAFVASGLLNQNESPRVRAAAMDVLAPLKEPGGSLIVQALNAEQDPIVRAAAARALGMTHVWNFASQLIGLSQNDPNPAVRAAAWTGFVSLLPSGNAQQLLQYAQELHQQQEWEREVVVLRQACDKLEKDQDQASLADRREAIGDLYSQNFKPPQPDQAIPWYRDALAYYQDPNQPQQPLRISELVHKLTEVYLGARQYQQALKFAADEILMDPRNQANVGPAIRNTAEHLKDSKNPADWEAARQLIDGALDIPKLEVSFQDALRFIRTQIPGPPATAPSH